MPIGDSCLHEIIDRDVMKTKKCCTSKNFFKQPPDGNLKYFYT